MNNRKMAIWMTAGALLLAVTAFSQSEQANGKGRAVVTVLAKQHGGLPAEVSQKDVSIKVSGKPALVTHWAPLRGLDARLELVLLIDSSARDSLGNQFSDITHFINGLPPNTKAAIGYMRNGRAVFAGPLTADHAEVLRALHLPGGPAGSSASPYFCLSELAKHWPSSDRGARREVVMVTDGVDNYEPEYDPNDPYVRAAIDDSVRVGIVVYSIYWQNQGPALTSYGENTGQSHLIEVTEATGGNNLWAGMGNPVSLQPIFEELTSRLENQYELGFSTRLDGKPAEESLKVSVGGLAVKVTAPKQVLVNQVSAAE
jgi:hypothetical protein